MTWIRHVLICSWGQHRMEACNMYSQTFIQILNLPLVRGWDICIKHYIYVLLQEVQLYTEYITNIDLSIDLQGSPKSIWDCMSMIQALIGQ